MTRPAPPLAISTIAAIAFTLFASAHASGQQAAYQPAIGGWVRDGEFVRLGLLGAPVSVEGRFLRATADSVYLRSTRDLRLAIANIQSLESQRGRMLGEGLLLGLAGGAALGAGIGLAVGPRGDFDRKGSAVLYGLGGGFVGLLVGATVGASLPRWVKVSLRPQ